LYGHDDFSLFLLKDRYSEEATNPTLLFGTQSVEDEESYVSRAAVFFATPGQN
jgi:hypothetical protein